MKPARNRQRGVALLLVLTWIALMVALVGQFTYGTNVDAAQAANARDELRAHYLAKSSVNLGRMLIKIQKQFIDPVMGQAQKLLGAAMGSSGAGGAGGGQSGSSPGLGFSLRITDYAGTLMGFFSGSKEDVAGLGSLVGPGGPLAPLMSSFTSDRGLKTDIQKVGVHQPTGLPLYSYRYKGDPKSYPKITGPMAEDAMQVAPHTVRTVGVHQPTGQALHTVDMNALDAAGPAIRPRRMPGANGSFATRVPGPLAPPVPAGLTGAMGANMRAQRMRPQARMPRVAGAMGSMGGMGG